jgi:acyl-CoA synthetase (AMP-forming)/AMP-acid ligase II
VTRLAVSMVVPIERAARYRAEGLWDRSRLADGIEAAAVERPDALALADNERRLSNTELSRAVANGVSALSAHGVAAGDGVVLVAGNTVHAVVAYHALLRVGATTLVLDRRCGAADVRHATDVLPGRVRIVAPTVERLRLVEGLDGLDRLDRLDRLGPPGAPGDPEWLDLEAFGDKAPGTPGTPGTPEAAGAQEVAWSGPEPDRDVPAVVLFTSGTTSKPKGVIHSLNTLTAGAANMARITGADEESVLFLVSPVASITGVMQMHLAADRQAALVLEDRFDPDASLDRINAVGATLLGGAPVIPERLLGAARRRSAPLALRTLALGGAMLPRPLLELATDAFGIDIARVYGSSEAPNFSGSTPGDDRERRLSDDGMLMPGSEVRVGSSAHPQEGLVRGPGVFLGYVDPADNAAAFEGDWFRTGDLVEVHDGRLTVIGRIKDVVNRNGLKISLSEIDAALAGLPGVDEHASFGLPDPSTGERLAVAVVVAPEGGVAITLADVVRHLVAQGIARRNLPEELVTWDGPLPRTASGKVVRSRLVMESPAMRSEVADRLHPA